MTRQTLARHDVGPGCSFRYKLCWNAFKRLAEGCGRSSFALVTGGPEEFVCSH
jgi:hypothetical protein